jgi:hypothetical protein
VQVILNQIEREKTYRSMWMANTKLALYYMAGYRRFSVFRPDDGHVEPHFLDENGDLEYQSQDILFETQKIMGNLNSINVRPVVGRKASTLDVIRQRGVAQTILDAVTDEDSLDEIQKEFNWKLVCLGMAGLHGHVDDHPTVGLTSEIEVVDPVELMPFPSVGFNLSAQRGLIRYRMVSGDWLRQVFGNRMVNRAKKEGATWYTIEQGDVMDTPESYEQGGHATHPSFNRSGRGTGTDTSMEVFEIAELWVDGPFGLVSEYCVISGKFEFQYEDFDGFEIYRPIEYSRFYENGTFHGAGHFHVRFGSHRAAERLKKTVFNNMRERDKYPLLVLPQGQFKEGMFNEVGGLKYIKWMSDGMVEDGRPFLIPLPNEGDAPARVAQYADSLGQRLDPLPEIDKGRVESFNAVQMLEEDRKKHLTLPQQSSIQAFSKVHRTILQQSVAQIQSKNVKLPIEHLTLDLAGVIINDDETVSFNQNPVPDIRRLKISIVDKNPKSRMAKMSEAMQMLQSTDAAGTPLTDADAFHVYMVMEGMEPAMWNAEVSEPVRMMVKNILTLYGDGENSGQVVLTPFTTRPDIQLRVLNAFMSGLVFSRASVDVQNEFIALKQTLEQWQGFVLPEGVPNPSDVVGGPPPQQGLPAGAGQ